MTSQAQTSRLMGPRVYVMVLEPTTSQECTLATLEVGRARCDAMSSFRVPHGKKLLAEPGLQVLGKRPCILNDEEIAAIRASTRTRFFLTTSSQA